MTGYISIVLLVLLFAGLAFLYISHRKAIRSSYERLDSRDRRIVETRCGQIEYAVQGEGSPVIVVHGISGGFDQGLDLATQHLGPGFLAIAPSRFGYLGTPLPDDATPASQADAFACLLDELGINRAGILGYSAGGNSAIQFALRHPRRTAALVLVSTAPAGESGALPPESIVRTLFGSDFVFWLLTTHLRPVMAPVIGLPRDYKLTREEKRVTADIMRSILPIQPRQEGAVFDMYVSNTDMSNRKEEYRLETISAPTLLVNAVDDPLAGYERAKTAGRRIPSARLVSIPRGGHIMLGAGDLVRSEIAGFLKQAFCAGQQDRLQ